jgi:putative acetyltransferase
MIIRPFRKTDFAAVLDIYAQAKLDELRFEEQEFQLLPLDRDPFRLGKLLESKIYVYEDDKILGYGAYCGQEIRALFVLPTSRRQGVGRAILKHLMAEIAGDISLIAVVSNYPAQKLYAQFGFNIVETFATDYNGQAVVVYKMLYPSIKDNH